MKKGFFAICLSLVVAIASIAVLAPSCGGGGAGNQTANYTAEVNATLDGSTWEGDVQYRLTTPTVGVPFGGTIVPKSFRLSTGSWTCDSVVGGPAGARLESITPSATQTLPSGGKITFTLNFKSICTIEVKATLDGSPWPSSGTGAVSYTLTRPGKSPTGTTSVPKSFTVDYGNWTCACCFSGGPPGAYLLGITPSPTQSVTNGGTITFTLNFATPIIRLGAIKDAEVREYEPGKNLGAAQVMYVAPWGPHPDSTKHRVFVWFPLSLPAEAQVQSARLYLYHSGCYGTGNHTNAAYRVTDVWEEMIITWGNQPLSAADPTDAISFDITETGVWRSWDVTPDIDPTPISNGWVSWVIKHIDEDAQEQATVVYTSAEGGVAPYLEITYLP